MGSRQRAVVAALAWTGIVAAGLGACGGSGSGGRQQRRHRHRREHADDGSTLTGIAGSAAAAASTAPTVLGDCTMFPAEAVFNTRIDDPVAFPVHASNASWIASIGGATAFHADWWLGDDPTQLGVLRHSLERGRRQCRDHRVAGRCSTTSRRPAAPPRWAGRTRATAPCQPPTASRCSAAAPRCRPRNGASRSRWRA
jgi:hypothetical protein